LLGFLFSDFYPNKALYIKFYDLSLVKTCLFYKHKLFALF